MTPFDIVKLCFFFFVRFYLDKLVDSSRTLSSWKNIQEEKSDFLEVYMEENFFNFLLLIE